MSDIARWLRAYAAVANGQAAVPPPGAAEVGARLLAAADLIERLDADCRRAASEIACLRSEMEAARSALRGHRKEIAASSDESVAALTEKPEPKPDDGAVLHWPRDFQPKH